MTQHPEQENAEATDDLRLNLTEQQIINEKEWENPANWRYGIFYYSEKDTRPWVPKRSMFGRRRHGGTPNFAVKSARATMMIIIGICLGIVMVVTILEKNGWLR